MKNRITLIKYANKSKNQVTVFVKYSYNSFYDLRSSKSMYSKQKGTCQN